MGVRGSVLIVDDDASLLDSFKSCLKMEGYYCETTGRAVSALELISNKNSFDMMITDIDMPDMNGLELTREAKRLNPDMKIIMMTGLTDKFSYDKVMEAGASDFIKKPFTLKELVSRIKQVTVQNDLEKSKAELQKRVTELEDFYSMAIAREMKMIELKEEIEKLKEELEKYKPSQKADT
jgi:DNA-binding NtrC family response regulator